MNILIVEGWSDKYTSREAQKRNKTSTSAMSKNLIYYYFKGWMFGENRFFEWRQFNIDKSLNKFYLRYI